MWPEAPVLSPELSLWGGGCHACSPPGPPRPSRPGDHTRTAGRSFQTEIEGARGSQAWLGLNITRPAHVTHQKKEEQRDHRLRVLPLGHGLHV